MPKSSDNNNTANSQVFSTINQATQWLKQDGLLSYPTESVWGIGCNAYNELAVQQILMIKQRSVDKGLIVVTDSIDRIEPLLIDLDAVQRKRVIDSWSQSAIKQTKQAQTWLLPMPNEVDIPTWITGRHESIAVRVISHPLVQKLCEQLVSSTNPFGFLVSTSCNPTGQSPATDLNQAYAYFSDKKNMAYLKGDTLGYTLPSQIKDALTGLIIR